MAESMSYTHFIPIKKHFVHVQKVFIKKIQEKPTISQDNDYLMLNPFKFWHERSFYKIEIMIILLKILYNSEEFSESVAGYVNIQATAFWDKQIL